MHLAVFLAMLLNTAEVNGFQMIVTSRRFPYQISLRFYNNDEHHCSGAIISRKYSLTAGHCICCYIKYYMLYAVLGANSFTHEGTRYDLENSICHEDFDYKFLRNDLAILKFKNELQFTKTVKPLPLINFKLKRQSILIMPVWGYKKNNVIPPMNFKVQFALLIDNKKCANMFGSKMVDDTNICTMASGPGACIGDSGGPVVFKQRLVGIVSYGMECSSGYPDVHTNISAFTDWITESIVLESF